MSTTASATNETSKTKTTHRTDKSKTEGYKSVPMRSLAAQLHLLQQVLKGMQTHDKDPDYPTALDGLGLAATYDNAAAKALAESDAKLIAKKRTGEAVAERTMVGVILEKVQDILLNAYGRRNLILLEYGFRPLAKRSSSSRKAHKAGTAAGTGTPGAGSTGGA